MTTKTFRRSVRDFKQEPLSQQILTEIIESATRNTPSWANSQPWKVYIATGNTLATIKADHIEHIEKGITGNADFSTRHREQWAERPQINMAHWSNDFMKYLVINKIDQANEIQQSLYNAPAVIYLTLDKNPSDWSIYDLGAFGQSILLAALEKGIDSMPAYEFVKYPDALRQIMDIPDSEVIAMGIGLGYRSENKINDFTSERNPLDTYVKIKD